MLIAAAVIDSTLAARVALPAPQALPWAKDAPPALAALAAQSQGWALLAPGGSVVATSLPERAQLLASVCAMLGLAGGGGTPPWRTVSLEGPAGVLLGLTSERGSVLAVLAMPGADVARLRGGMEGALRELERQERLPPAFPTGNGVSGPDGPHTL